MASTRDIEAGRAFIRVSVRENLAGLKNISAKLKNWGASISGMGAKMTAIGGVMAMPFIGAIKAASDMEETMSKFNVVFGESAGEVKSWSDQFASAVGRSKQQAASFMAGSQDLFVPLGFAADAATELSKQVTMLAVDLGSFNNMADEDVIRDLHAALTGSGEVMKKYGVLVSEAAVKQELLNKGMDPKTATDQQKVQARLNIIMAGTTAAQGDAIRTAGGFANQMKKLWGTINDVAVVIGSALLPVVTPIVTKAGELATVIGAWAEKNKGLAVTIAAVVAGVVAAGTALMILGGTIAVMGFALGGIAAVLGVILSPLGLFVAAVVGGTAAFLAFTETGQQVVATLQGEFGGLLTFVQGVIGGISDAFAANDFKLAASIAWAAVVVAWEEAKHALMSSWNAVANGWDEFWTGMASIMDGVVTSIRSAWASVVGWISQKLLQVWGLIEKALSAVGLLNETTDIGGAVRAVADQTAADKAGLADAKNARDQERGAGLSSRKAERELGASEGLVAAREELANLLAEAAQKAAVKEWAPDYSKRDTPSPGDTIKAGMSAAGIGASLTGTFSAHAAMAAFAGPKTEDAAKETADNTKRMAKTMERLLQNVQAADGAVFA